MKDASTGVEAALGWKLLSGLGGVGAGAAPLVASAAVARPRRGPG